MERSTESTHRWRSPGSASVPLEKHLRTSWTSARKEVLVTCAVVAIDGYWRWRWKRKSKRGNTHCVASLQLQWRIGTLSSPLQPSPSSEARLPANKHSKVLEATAISIHRLRFLREFNGSRAGSDGPLLVRVPFPLARCEQHLVTASHEYYCTDSVQMHLIGWKGVT